MKSKKSLSHFLPAWIAASGLSLFAIPSQAQADVIVYNQNNPPDATDLPSGGWGTYRGFSMTFNDAALSAAYTGPDEAPLPAALYLTNLAVRHPGTQGSLSTAPGDWTTARLKVYTTQTPTTGSYVGDSLETNDMSMTGAERNVTFTFGSLPLAPGTKYYFFFSNTAGNVDPASQTWTGGRLRVSNNAAVTYGSGNLINATWGNQDTAFDAVFAATFSSTPPSSGDIIWTGNDGGVWDIETTQNWRLSDNTPVVYANGNNLTFDDSASTGAVTLSGSPINPGAITFSNETLDYTVSGDSWAGPGAVTKTGAGTTTLLVNAGHFGGTTISGGTLRIGEDGTSGSLGNLPVTNDASLVIERSDTITMANAISGSGTLTIEGTGTTILSGASTYTGGTLVNDGTLRVSGTLASTVTVANGARITAGPAGATGTGTVGGLVLVSGSRSAFRAVFGTSDRLIVSDGNALTISGPHQIDLIPTGIWEAGDEFDLFQYAGSLSGDINNLTVGEAPHGSYSLHDDGFDLVYVRVDELETLVWKGNVSTAWDLNQTANWALLSDDSQVPYFQFDRVLFNDSATTGDVNLTAAFTPMAFEILNDTRAFTFTGSGVAGAAGIVKNGPGSAVWASPNAATGGLSVNGGVFTIGDGAMNGDAPSGAVVVQEGATLAFDLDSSVTRDYKAVAKMRNVSGAGDIVVDGGFKFFNYTGAGAGFSDANSWAGFSGRLIVKGGSEFQTIRNGATAMGTAQVILGDESSGGKLSQIEGNWAWTNPIRFDGAANEIINCSAGSPRTLKLQGVLSGDGNVTFRDAAGGMGDNQRGFILTAANTLSGTITVDAGVPLRVGGVPGNSDATQFGAGNSGSLGGADVVVDGTLTFSRNDAHMVANDVSGIGAIFIGLTTGTADQVVNLTGEVNNSGATTVRNGTLLINGSHGFPFQPLNVRAAGTLGGAGVTDSEIVLEGTLSPGNSTGTLTTTDWLSIQAGSRYVWELGAWENTQAGVDSDLVGASLVRVLSTIESPSVISVSSAGVADFSETDRSFVIASGTGGVEDFDATKFTIDATAFTTATGATGTWEVALDGSDIVLHYTAGDGLTGYAAWLVQHEDEMNGETALDQDADDDGVPNGIEFILGGDPTLGNDVALPLLADDGETMTFTFDRHNNAADLEVTVETSVDLVDWDEEVYLIGADTAASSAGVDISAGTGPDGSDHVTVTLPKNGALKKFVRLKVSTIAAE